MNKRITIAIDGYSSCGKSTLAKALAAKLGYVFIDTGAMYRGVSLYCLDNNLISEGEINVLALIDCLDKIDLKFELNPDSNKPELLLNSINVEDKIRKIAVSTLVSKVASIKEVRQKLVKEQRLMGEQGGVVMDGRDIGSVVFPNAELKLFITSDPQVRVERRFLELSTTDQSITRKEIEENLNYRDLLDTTREESPLVQAEDAIVIDNTNLNQDQQLDVAYNYVLAILKN
jgi:cytidylate kinase